MRALLLVAAFCAFPAFAQTQTAPAAPNANVPAVSADEAELVRLSNEWMEAVVKHDFDKLESIMAPEFSLMGWDGSRRVPRSSWLRNVRNMTDSTFDYKIISARTFGDLGVVYSVGDFAFKLNGNPGASPGVMTDVWQRRGGKWVVVARRSLRFSELKKFMDAIPQRPAQ